MATEKPWKTHDCRLVLEDGSVWSGLSFGAKGTAVGEVVFNTSLSGYQEILTDPSYAGQFVLFTCPEIGNGGINLDNIIGDLRERIENHLQVVGKNGSEIIFKAVKYMDFYITPTAATRRLQPRRLTVRRG